MSIRRYAAILAVCLSAPLAAAQAESPTKPVIEKSIPLDWALTLAKTASEACLARGFATTVTVVDQRGQPRVQLTREGAFPHSVETSRRKAVTAASRRLPTAEIAETNQHEPSLGAVFHAIGMTTLSGGLPILHEGDVIGGIGIAGAPGEDESGRDYDDLCAEAGLAAIAVHLN